MVLKKGLCHFDGFTLVEVLVSMVIMAIGLLGLAALQGRALKDNQDAYLYSQASLLAYEMGDRIKANVNYWGVFTDPATGNPTVNDISLLDPNSSQVCGGIDESCNPVQMASADLSYWQSSAGKILPPPNSGSMVAIRRSRDVGQAPCNSIDMESLCLITRWARVNTRANSSLTADMEYYFEITPK